MDRRFLSLTLSTSNEEKKKNEIYTNKYILIRSIRNSPNFERRI